MHLKSMIACALVAGAPSLLSAGQTRLEGMGNPLGLVENDSDYQIHPSLLNPTRIESFAAYTQEYTRTPHWDFNAYGSGTAVAHTIDLGGQGNWSFSNSGHGRTQNAQLGMIAPAGFGSWGILFTYRTENGDYNHGQAMQGVGYVWSLQDHLLDWKTSLVLATQEPSCRLGLALDLGYQHEKADELAVNAMHHDPNFPWGAVNFSQFLYAIPGDASYYQANAKLSLSGKGDQASWAITLTGGMPFASTSTYNFAFFGNPFPAMKGSVQGFNTALEGWLRVPLSATLTLPIQASASLVEHDKSGIDANHANSFSQHDRQGHLGLGMGLDALVSPSTRLALGLNADLNQRHQDFFTTDVTFPMFAGSYNYSKFPDQEENRLTLKTAFEHHFTSGPTLRAGLDLFYGWVRTTYTCDVAYANTTINEPSKGSHKGIQLSLGSTFQAGHFAIEPFLAATATRLSTESDGWTTLVGSTLHARTADALRTDQGFRGGVSLKF